MIKETGFANYEHLISWAQLPDGVTLEEVPDVAVDSKDNVYAMTRNPANPIVVFDDSGKFLHSFGQGTFTNRAHGITVGPDDSIYCADDGTHKITKFTPDGDLVMTLDTGEVPSERWSGKPFNRPTQACVSPSTGDIFVTDGYGNARVHRFSADGEYILSWGECGVDGGQFIIPHNIAIDLDGNVFVADRECNRIQVFDANGKFHYMISNVHRPDGMKLGPDGNIYVAELTAALDLLETAPGLGHRISVLTPDGDLVARYGGPYEGEGEGEFIAPHGIAVNSVGDIYVGEVSWTIRGRKLDPPRKLRCFSKLAKSRPA